MSVTLTNKLIENDDKLRNLNTHIKAAELNGVVWISATQITNGGGNNMTHAQLGVDLSKQFKEIIDILKKKRAELYNEQLQLVVTDVMSDGKST